MLTLKSEILWIKIVNTQKLERHPDSVYINTAKLNKNRVLKFMEKIVEKKL